MGFNGNTKCTFIVRTSDALHHLSLKLTGADYTTFAISFMEWYKIADMSVSPLASTSASNYFLGDYTTDGVYFSPLKDTPDAVGTVGGTVFQYTDENSFVK